MNLFHCYFWYHIRFCKSFSFSNLNISGKPQRTKLSFMKWHQPHHRFKFFQASKVESESVALFASIESCYYPGQLSLLEKQSTFLLHWIIKDCILHQDLLLSHGDKKASGPTYWGLRKMQNESLTYNIHSRDNWYAKITNDSISERKRSLILLVDLKQSSACHGPKVTTQSPPVKSEPGLVEILRPVIKCSMQHLQAQLASCQEVPIAILPNETAKKAWR